LAFGVIALFIAVLGSRHDFALWWISPLFLNFTCEIF